jgi:methylated-DNA-[protein]-cysteine S-methyltransferase
MKEIYIQYVDTIIGELILGTFEDKLCLLNYKLKKTRASVDQRIKKGLGAEFVEDENELLKESKKQLNEFLHEGRKVIDIPVLMVGTEFQKKVWQSLLEVPYGTTSTYLELAKKIENEKAVRAVANANAANAISIIIPCHRIIGSNGKLVGYGGGLNAKEQLLKIEKEKL